MPELPALPELPGNAAPSAPATPSIAAPKEPLTRRIAGAAGAFGLGFAAGVLPPIGQFALMALRQTQAKAAKRVPFTLPEGTSLASWRKNPPPPRRVFDASRPGAEQLQKSQLGAKARQAKQGESDSFHPHSLAAEVTPQQQTLDSAPKRRFPWDSPGDPPRSLLASKSADAQRVPFSKVPFAPSSGLNGLAQGVPLKIAGEYHSKARQAGLNPTHVHGLARDIRTQDAQYTGEVTEAVQRAREMSAKMGFGDLSSLAARHAKGKIDYSHLKGFDQLAEEFGQHYPHLVKNHDPDQTLYDLLVQGAPKPINHGEAYEQAMTQLHDWKEYKAPTSLSNARQREPGEDEEDKPEEKERVFEPAFRTAAGKMYVSRGIHDISVVPWEEREKIETGFRTNKGRFLTRDEAEKLAGITHSADINDAVPFERLAAILFARKDYDTVDEALWQEILHVCPTSRPLALPYIAGKVDGCELCLVDLDEVMIRPDEPEDAEHPHMDAVSACNDLEAHWVAREFGHHYFLIDVNLAPHDWPFCTMHEAHERRLMEGGMPYDTAHVHANAVEKQLRIRCQGQLDKPYFCGRDPRALAFFERRMLAMRQYRG